MTTAKPDTFLTEAQLNVRDPKKELLSPIKIHTPFQGQSPVKSPLKKSKFTANNENNEEEEDEQDMDRKKRRWTLIIKKISFLPNPEDYYSKLTIKPGFHFWKALALSKYPLSNLRVNIPESLLLLDVPYLIYTDELSGKIIRKPDASYNEFEGLILAENKKFINKYLDFDPASTKFDYEKNPDIPFIVSRTPAGNPEHLISNSVHSYKSHKDRRIGGVETNKLEQRYIIARALQASIFRLCYYTKNANLSEGVDDKSRVKKSYYKANYGYRITNKISIFSPSQSLSLLSKAMINSEKFDSFEIMEVKGLSLKPFEIYTERVVTFLEKAYCVRISEVVLDFIQDMEGKIWLIGMKSIKMEDALSMQEISGTGEGKKTLDDLTCSVYCKLCGLLFKKDDASKVLTYKLLWELVQHLKKRGMGLKNIKVSHSSTRPCRVCNLCYMLVVGEHELIEIEQQFARAQNIPIYDAVVRVPIDIKPKHRPALLSENLHQWRLMFYVNEIYGIEENLRNIDLNDFYLQYKLHNFKTCFKINLSFKEKNQGNLTTPLEESLIKEQINKNSNQSLQKSQSKNALQLYKIGTTSNFKQNYLGVNTPVHSPKANTTNQVPFLYVNKIRVHYFFSESENIEKFLQDTEIKVRLTNGTDWNNFVAEGSSKTISHFQNKQAVGQRDKKKQTGGQRHTSQILCFFENSQYCTLKLNAGLVWDDKYNTENLNLYKYNNIYFPDESFYNSDPFPNEWMEMFDPSSVKLRDDIEEKIDYEKYSPKCTVRDLNKMIDYDAYKGRSSFKHVESKIKRTQSASTSKMLPKAISDPLMNLNFNSNVRPQSKQEDYSEYNSQNKKNNQLKLNSGNKNSKRNSLQKDPYAIKLFDKNDLEIDEKNSFTNQIESYDAYNLILDRNNKKNEEELNVMKKYDILDENLIQEDDDKEIRDKIKEHMGNLNGTGKNNSVRIRSGNMNSGVKSLKIQTAASSKKNEIIEGEDHKNFLNAKKQQVTGQVSYDYTEHL